jgi:hypothetical protein
MPIPPLTFIAFELVVLALFGACLAHAWRTGPTRVWALVAGALFGVLLEWATIQQLRAYSYGRFMLMWGEVPIAIGLAWGTIIYTARLTSDATSLPGWARPVFDGLLGLNLDLAMDALAIRLGFWDWGGGLEVGYFGVPYANFWAWFWVVFFFSAGWRLMERWRHPWAPWAAPIGAIVVGVIGVLATNRFIVSGVQGDGYLLSIGFVIGAAIGVVAALRPQLHVHPTPWVAIVVPFVYHAFYLVLGLVTGVILQPPFLLGVSLAMIVVSLGLHLPWRRRLSATA